MDPIERAAKIKSALFSAGFRLADVDRSYGLPRGSASDALRNPNKAAEEALADALDMTPETLFPERFDAIGHRLDPQPPENYERPPTMAQRRKGGAGRTANLSKARGFADTSSLEAAE